VPFAAMERVTAAAFGQRRKMLRASLKTLGAETAERLLAETGLSPTARAEEIDIAGFVALSRAWASTAEPPMA
jgi:16S rRNA (adenine1518-N6/adenine1519-N6)-dimethyltransferase